MYKQEFQPPATNINQPSRIIRDRLSRDSSNKEVFNTSKGEYEQVQKRSGYNNIIFSFQQSSASHVK